jgi:hypothetical protein
MIPEIEGVGEGGGYPRMTRPQTNLKDTRRKLWGWTMFHGVST